MIGVILSSKFVGNTLQAQFGKILPIELPIQNRTLISNQVESIESMCNSIYVTIPNGYPFDCIQKIIKLELDHNLSLMDVLREISQKFLMTDRLFIYYGDSLFLNIGKVEKNKNYFFLQKPMHQYKWGISAEDGCVPAGGIIIENSKLNHFLKKSSNFDELASFFFQSGCMNPFYDFEWLDFGHTLTFYNSRKKFLESRSFNKLEHKEGFIIKSSKDTLKMWAEFNWLKNCKEKMPANIPFVTDFNISKTQTSYSIEYINHPALSDIFVFGKISDYFFIKILESIKATILNFRKIEFHVCEKRLGNFLVDKLIARKKELIEITINLNGDVNFVEKLIAENINYYFSKQLEFTPIHGDLCFSNILFDFSVFQPILIDPRGYVSEQTGFSMYGPGCYDYYKLAHSYVIGYDYLIARKDSTHFFSRNETIKRLNLFCDLFEIEKQDLLMGLKNLFLSLIPLHNDSIPRQKLFLLALNRIDEL